jgi:ubiquinone/menaquinone biosynthesis C-methylase UbiE
MDEAGYYIDYLKRTTRFPQSVYHRAKLDMVRNTIQSQPQGSRVLDAGCGIGHITNEYCDRYEVYGLDEQPAAIDYCWQHCRGTYVQGDLCEIPFSNDFFDLILFLDAIEHLTNPIRALRELARILKPGGAVLICTMSYSSPLWFVLEHTWHRFCGGTCKPYLKDVHPTHYTKKLLRQHCSGIFEEVYLTTRIMHMELFYFGRKPECDNAQ